MRYVFNSFGSRGDLQPTFLLARALKERGHDVVVVGPPNFSDWARRMGIHFFGAGDDMQMLLEREKQHVKATPLALMREMQRLLFEQFEKVTRVMDPLITSDAVIIASAVSLVAASFARARNCRYHYLALQPQLFRHSGLPPPVVPQAMSWPPWSNRILARFHDLVWSHFLRPMFDPLHKRLGIPALGDVWQHMLGPDPILACEPALVGALDSRLPACQGAIVANEENPLPPPVQTFLSHGSTPIYVGFGSMPDEAPENTVQTIVSVARSLKVRLVLSSGWAKLQAMEADDVCVIGEVSHAALFGKVRAVVHHGGAGTTSRASFSGIPQLIVPHMLDQYYWGARIHQLALGPRPLPRTRFNPITFASRLRELLAHEKYASNAQQLANQMIPNAVDRILKILERPVFAPAE